MFWLVSPLGHAAPVLVLVIQRCGRKTFADTTRELCETVRETEHGLLHETRCSLWGGQVVK